MDYNKLFEKRNENFKFVLASIDAGLKDTVIIGIDEFFWSLKEAIYDLTDEQLQAFPIEGHPSIHWIALHMLGNIEHFVNLAFTGQEGIVEYAHKYGTGAVPTPSDEMFSTKELIEKLLEIREKTFTILDGLSEQDLLSVPPKNKARWKRRRLDAYNRTIFHAMAHLRQIWLLRGAQGLTDGSGWPLQHWA
ncbi:MAG: DinB family protein [Candidatus Hodarchaeota archaeon]